MQIILQKKVSDILGFGVLPLTGTSHGWNTHESRRTDQLLFESSRQVKSYKNRPTNLKAHLAS